MRRHYLRRQRRLQDRRSQYWELLQLQRYQLPVHVHDLGHWVRRGDAATPTTNVDCSRTIPTSGCVYVDNVLFLMWCIYVRLFLFCLLNIPYFVTGMIASIKFWIWPLDIILRRWRLTMLWVLLFCACYNGIQGVLWCFGWLVLLFHEDRTKVSLSYLSLDRMKLKVFGRSIYCKWEVWSYYT